MALIRQSITTNSDQVYALACALNSFLFRLWPAGEKLTVAQFLAKDPLLKLTRRLENKHIRELQFGKYREFEFTFSPEELLSIRICIGSGTGDKVLQVILGKIDQKLLNYENKIELNHKSLKQ